MSTSTSSLSSSTDNQAGVTRTMRAVQLARYGAPEQLAETEVAVPSLPSGCVLIRVAATSVNPVDMLARRGLLRFATGFRMPLGTGMDYSGRVVEIADDVTSAELDSAVWGFLGLPRHPTAAAAEFVVARAGTFALAPTSIDAVNAAALPLVASTALVALRDHLHLTDGERLLVRGGAGGVGSAAIQLGKAMGARVTALVSSRDLNFARELGADAAVDYRTHSPEQLGEFDAILDTKGTGLVAYQQLLPPHGRIVSTAAGGFIYAAATAITGGRRVRTFGVGSQADVLKSLTDYVDRGLLKPVVDTVWDLRDIAGAHRALETGVTRGKHVVRV